MTKKEFLNDIKESLEQEVSSTVLQENLKYYNDYIEDEVRKGRSEQEVISELGDPWALAKTIIDMQESQGYTYGEYQETENTYQESQTQKAKVFRIDSMWKKILLYLVIGFVLFTIVSVVSGIVSILAPIALPVLAVIFVIQFLKNFKR